MLKVQALPRFDWKPLAVEGCVGVEARGLLKQEHLALAMLRFAPQATIHEHAAPFPVDVVCLQGAGMTSVDGEAATIRAGERVHWPADRPHRLWTEESEMMTLMIEHIAEKEGGN